MNIVLYIVLPVAGIVLGWIIRWIYARFQLTASEQKAERVKQDAIREAEAQKKEILLNAKDELIRERNQQERENRERRAEVQRFEARVNKKEELLDQRAAEFEKNEKELADKKAAMVKREEELSKQEELYRQELEKISGLSQQEPRPRPLQCDEAHRDGGGGCAARNPSLEGVPESECQEPPHSGQGSLRVLCRGGSRSAPTRCVPR